ncbi:unnamed protein product [Triticum turgidum subsp. durum]|uniref:F-box domain-containing protein n=1 Tax=Triticum turgidum subsp. durum TaxID=4567 RepID=A0A9R1BTU3_TRITD|nr:unnamed protein product [Triticum turgidum subsp. durum]
MAPTLTDLPSGLLTEILLRLPAPEDLARASAACPAFRRVATDGTFLRRFRCLHAPRLLAFIDLDGFQPALPPHPSAPAARALSRAADFSFSFLPSHCRWVPMDVRDGRVLLGRDHGQDARPPICRELAVCDPLHRRYVLLPPVPDALVASTERPPPVRRRPFDEPLLLPVGEHDEATAFTVISMVHCETKLAPFVFSSSTGQWRAAAPMLWSAMPVSPMDHTYLRRHHAYGCFYWESTLIKRRELLVLNIQRMEFSIAELPSSGWGTLGVAIVEAGEGRLGLFGIRDGTAGGKPDLCYTVRRNKGKNSGRWQMVKTFSLGSEGLNYIKAATERYVLLICSEALRFVGLSMEMPDLEYISVDVKKLQLERVCVKPFGNSLSRTRIYAHFPPSLSSPTI